MDGQTVVSDLGRMEAKVFVPRPSCWSGLRKNAYRVSAVIAGARLLPPLELPVRRRSPRCRPAARTAASSVRKGRATAPVSFRAGKISKWTGVPFQLHSREPLSTRDIDIAIPTFADVPREALELAGFVYEERFPNSDN